MKRRCGGNGGRTERKRFIFAPGPVNAVPTKHGKTAEESLHSFLSLYAVYLWDHDGTEDPEAWGRLLGSGSGLGAPADDRGEAGPGLCVP